jgi:hypothetical protein
MRLRLVNSFPAAAVIGAMQRGRYECARMRPLIPCEPRSRGAVKVSRVLPAMKAPDGVGLLVPDLRAARETLAHVEHADRPRCVSTVAAHDRVDEVAAAPHQCQPKR